jgi:alkylhydroperoxidase/carboxymuconolactone decarboxylase family protein YurZ
VKQIMAPGALDPLTKELIYVAVSASALTASPRIPPPRARPV